MSQNAKNRRQQMKLSDVNLKNTLPHKAKLNDGTYFTKILCMENCI